MISNLDDTIYSIDVIEAIDNADESDYDPEEINHLIDLAKECEDFDDWEYGVNLIRDSYFKDYAIDLAYELGLVPTDYVWPTSCIDWNQAARELQMDYSAVEYNGVTYWIR
jgi:hypothetical protein